jgi:tetratricopeptide (TPR) repeat protein
LLLALAGCDEKAQETYVDGPRDAAFQSFNAPSAIDELKNQLLNNPDDFNTLSRLGDMYFESSQYFEAIQTYDRAIAVNPACADCFNDKGLALFYLGDADGSLVALGKATEIDPSYVHAWLSTGFVMVSTGRYQEAVAPLNRVKELDTTGILAAEADKFLAMANRGTQQ